LHNLCRITIIILCSFFYETYWCTSPNLIRGYISIYNRPCPNHCTLANNYILQNDARSFYPHIVFNNNFFCSSWLLIYWKFFKKCVPSIINRCFACNITIISNRYFTTTDKFTSSTNKYSVT
jgi:hypothetical protein